MNSRPQGHGTSLRRFQVSARLNDSGGRESAQADFVRFVAAILIAGHPETYSSPQHLTAYFRLGKATDLGPILFQILQIYSYIVILDVILSWVVMASRHGAAFAVKAFTGRLVEPALSPIRRVLRPYTRDMPIDFSPLVLLLLISVLQRLVIRLAF